MAKEWQNKSGYNDPTAYEATRPTEEEIQVGKLVKAIKSVAQLFGFYITNRVEFKSIESGKMYR